MLFIYLDAVLVSANGPVSLNRMTLPCTQHGDDLFELR